MTCQRWIPSATRLDALSEGLSVADQLQGLLALLMGIDA